MTGRRAVTAAFLREPRQGTLDWMVVGFGVAVLVLSVASIFVQDALGGLFSVGAEFVLLGLAFGCMGGAELLPVELIRLAAGLRVLTLVLFVGWAALLLAG